MSMLHAYIFERKCLQNEFTFIFIWLTMQEHRDDFTCLFPLQKKYIFSKLGEAHIYETSIARELYTLR